MLASSEDSSCHDGSKAHSSTAELAHFLPEYPQDTTPTSAEPQPFSIPFATAVNHDDDDDPFQLPTLHQQKGADSGTTEDARSLPGSPQDNELDISSQDASADKQQSISSNANFGHHAADIASLQKDLQGSWDRCRQLEAELSAMRATQSSEQKLHQQQLEAASQQHQQQLHLLHQQQHTEAAHERRRTDSLQQQLQSSEQQTQKLQLQLSQQVRELKEAHAAAAGLQSDLTSAQQQKLAAQIELTSYQQQADSQMSHHLHEQQQALFEAHHSLEAAQAELRDLSSDFESSQAELQAVSAQHESSEIELRSLRPELAACQQSLVRAQERSQLSQQSLSDSDRDWEGRLQQQRAATGKLQMVCIVQ